MPSDRSRLVAGQGHAHPSGVDHAVVDRCLEHVLEAQEAGRELGSGVVPQLVSGSRSLDTAGLHDGDLISHGEGLVAVVGDIEDSGVDLVEDAPHLDQKALAQGPVERPDRFVQHDEPWCRRERPGQGNPLLFSSRKRPHRTGVVARQTNEIERGRDAVGDLFVGATLHA